MRRLDVGVVRLLLLSLLLPLAVLSSSQSAHAGSHVTAYLPTGNVTYYGYDVFTGEAACSWSYPVGTLIQFWDGFIVECLDRGALDENGVSVDILAWSYSEAVYYMTQYDGTELTIVRWGFGGY